MVRKRLRPRPCPRSSHVPGSLYVAHSTTHTQHIRIHTRSHHHIKVHTTHHVHVHVHARIRFLALFVRYSTYFYGKALPEKLFLGTGIMESRRPLHSTAAMSRATHARPQTLPSGPPEPQPRAYHGPADRHPRALDGSTGHAPHARLLEPARRPQPLIASTDTPRAPSRAFRPQNSASHTRTSTPVCSHPPAAPAHAFAMAAACLTCIAQRPSRDPRKRYPRPAQAVSETSKSPILKSLDLRLDYQYEPQPEPQYHTARPSPRPQ